MALNPGLVFGFGFGFSGRSSENPFTSTGASQLECPEEWPEGCGGTMQIPSPPPPHSHGDSIPKSGAGPRTWGFKKASLVALMQVGIPPEKP